jgi:hypothetical protein
MGSVGAMASVMAQAYAQIERNESIVGRRLDRDFYRNFYRTG